MDAPSTSLSFNPDPILNYLGLPLDYEPSIKESPINFLSKHLHLLPPNLLVLFSALLTPQQRTVLPIIRNRRQKYTSTYPKELSTAEARKQWPLMWQGRDRPGVDQGKEEKLWADREFLGGQRGQQIGKLGSLLATYEEEREAERVREARRGDLESRMAAHSLTDEGEEVEEDEDDDDQEYPITEEYETPQQVESNFERLIRERFIYGLLDNIDYDAVDWDDRWDEIADRDSEEQWFDEEEEADAPLIADSVNIEQEYVRPPTSQVLYDNND